jgi:hypothetical protein
MNKRILELIEQSNLDVIQTSGMDNIVDGCYIVSIDKIEKFTKLVVLQCCNIADEVEKADMDSFASKYIKAHFEIKE